MPRGRPRKNPVPALGSADLAEVEASLIASTSTAPDPAPPAPPSPAAGPDAGDTDISMSEGRRSSRRSAAKKIVNYSTQFSLGDGDEEGDEDDELVGKGKAPDKRRKRVKAEEDDSEEEFKPAAANGDDDDDDDEHIAPDEEDDDDSEEDSGAEEEPSTSKPKLKPFRKVSNRKSSTVASSSTPSSSSAQSSRRNLKPPKSVKASKTNFAMHERRPVFLFGESMAMTTSEQLLTWREIGKQRAKLTTLADTDKQLSMIRQVAHVWSARNHFTHTRPGQSAKTNSYDVIDTAWYPGKVTSHKQEKKRRDLVKKYWTESSQVDDDLIQQIQAVGGVFLLGPESAKATPFAGPSKRKFNPPPAPTQSTYDDLEQQKQLETFVEQQPLCLNAQGDFDVLMGAADNSQQLARLERGKAKNLQDCNLPSGTSGAIANCGSFISSVDWAPNSLYAPAQAEYIAVGVQLSAPPGQVPRTILGQRNKEKVPGAIQIWSLGAQDPTSLELEFTIGVPVGEVVQMMWCPVGYDFQDELENSATRPGRIGVLACALTCGKILLYAVPRPAQVSTPGSEEGKPLINLTPVAELPVHGCEPICLDWAGGERLMAGCSNGSILVWHTGDILRSIISNNSTTQICFPSHTFLVHETAVTSVSFLALPPRPVQSLNKSDDDDDGSGYGFDGLPHLVLTASTDGSSRVLDLDMMDISAEAQKQREPAYSTSYFSFLSTWISERGDGAVRVVNPRPGAFCRTHLIGLLQGRATTVQASSLQPLIASGSADGTVLISPTLKNVTKNEERSNWPLYRLDINRATGQLRYVDNCGINSNGMGVAGNGQTMLGSYHPSIRITSVAWCPNLGVNPFLLASSSACGLLRVDMVAHDPSQTPTPQGDVEMADS
ncbi:unnamed protein product [Sympodiomycopsis kandeliae]